MIEVRFERGLYLPECDLWLDPWDAKPRAFVSHGHADHFARHDEVICSERTAGVVRTRFGLAAGKLRALPFQVPHAIDGFRVQLLPAGHAFGSSMIHLTRLSDQQSLLYTGDFKTRRSRVAEPTIFAAADTLILETTYGLPKYQFPPQIEVEAGVMNFVSGALADGETPVLLGYSFGKAQEALALLDAHGVPAMLHPAVAEMTLLCRSMGAVLPEPIKLEPGAKILPGHALIAPPGALRSKLLRNMKNTRTAMLSGWALQPGSQYRYQVDEVIPMSDHADHPGLMECVQRVRPRRVLTVHGFAREFAAELRARGIDAWSAAGGDQLELTALISGNPSYPPNALHSSGKHHRLGASNRPGGSLANFSDLCRRVGETRSRIRKVRELAKYLRELDADDALRRAARYLAAEPIPRSSGRRSLQIGPAILRRAILSLPGCRIDRYREISASQNDSARTARLVMEELSLDPERVEMEDLQVFFHQLAVTTGSLARIEMLSARLRRLHPVEAETWVKLLTGDLRIGLRDGLVEEAIAAAFDADPAQVRHACMLTGDIGETAVLAARKSLHLATLRPHVPIKCMLASPHDRSNDDASHGPPFQPLPYSPPFWIEPKFDGVRAQLHKQGAKASLFSRDLRPLDDDFPELLDAAVKIPGDWILDGEVIAYADGRKLGFNDLQKRLGRKSAGLDLFLKSSTGSAAIPLRFIAFDILWHQGRDLTGLPLHKRRVLLDSIAIDKPIEAIEIHQAMHDSEVGECFNQALRDGHEGLIVKDPESTYVPGRRGRSWLKLKGVMPTLDCVVTIAEQGHGRRSHVLSDYTFAVRDESSGALRVLGKAYSGLTDDEIEQLTAHFKKTTLRKERRKHHVEPDVVLEIAFDSIRPSTRHDSGLALRFPRIKAIRRDKSVAEIDTLESARKLLR